MSRERLSTLVPWAVATTAFALLWVIFHYGQFISTNVDIVLIGWWLLVATTIFLFVVASRIRRSGQSADSVISIAVLTSLVSIVGGVVFLAIGYWTWLLFLTARTLFVLLFLLPAWFAFSPRMITRIQNSPAPSRLSISTIRIIALPSALVAILFGWSLVRDVTVTQTAKGTVSQIRTYAGKTSSAFYIVVDGHEYRALRNVVLPTEVGDHVQIEFGAGTHTVFKLIQIPRTPRPNRSLQ